MDIQNFAFVKTIDAESLTKAIVFINRTRRPPFRYTRITQSGPRNGWIALIIHSPAPDHYLMRNISGRMGVRTFELSCNGLSMAYRLHSDGKTIAAFESHLSLWITQQLRLLMGTGDVTQIDLAEPAGRLILKRYHEYRRSWSYSASRANESVTPDIAWHYAGRAEELKDYFISGTDISYVQEIMKPGFSVSDAFERLLEVIELPYIRGESLAVSLNSAASGNSSNAHQSDGLEGQQLLRGTEVLNPATWNDRLILPRGWIDITENQWKTEPPPNATVVPQPYQSR